MMIELGGPTRLFFSVFPDPPAAVRIGQTAQNLRREYGFSGRVPPNKVSLLVMSMRRQRSSIAGFRCRSAGGSGDR
jgi:hypothetical protein